MSRNLTKKNFIIIFNFFYVKINPKLYPKLSFRAKKLSLEIQLRCMNFL